MAKLVLVADLHLKAVDPFDRSVPRWREKIDRLVEVLQTEQPDVAVFLGDTFDTPNPPEWLREALASAITDLVPQMWFIVGNHERSFRGSAIDSWFSIGRDGLRVFTSPQSHTFAGLRFSFAPWHWSGWDSLSLVPAGDVLFGHFLVQSAAMVWGADRKDLIPDSALSTWPVTALGDVHIQLKLPVFSSGWHGYVGAFLHTSWSDAAASVGYGVLDTVNPSDVHLVKLEDRPFVTLEINSLDELPDPSSFEEAYVRIRIKRDLAKSSEFLDWRNALSGTGSRLFVDTVDSEDVESFAHQSVGDLPEDWIAWHVESVAPPASLSSEKVLEFGRKLYAEAVASLEEKEA